VRCEAQWTRRVKILNPSISGTGNIALEIDACEKDGRKCDKTNLRNAVPILCAVRNWLWNAGRRAQSTKVNGGTREELSRVLIGMSEFVGRPEGELQWQADLCQVRPSRIYSRMSGSFAYQVLWKITGRSASCVGVATCSSLPLFDLLLRDLFDSPSILDRRSFKLSNPGSSNTCFFCLLSKIWNQQRLES
jgi:hypothetical protein